jgi:hypothetical protein
LIRADLPERSTQVVELGTPDVAAALDLDRGDQRRVGLEGPFDALARGDLADDETGVEAAVALGDDDAFVGLQTFARALLDLDLDDDRVAGRELRNDLAQTGDFLLLKLLDQIHCMNSMDDYQLLLS